MLVGAWVAVYQGAPIGTAGGLGLLAALSLVALLVNWRINSQLRARRRFESVRDRLRDSSVRAYRFEVRRYWYVARHPDEYAEFGFTVLLETTADPVPEYVGAPTADLCYTGIRSRVNEKIAQFPGATKVNSQTVMYFDSQVMVMAKWTCLPDTIDLRGPKGGTR